MSPVGQLPPLRPRDSAACASSSSRFGRTPSDSGWTRWARNWNALTAQDKANLKRLAERQLELARQVDKTQSRMAEMQAELRDAEPLAAETLADALEIARRTAISGQMRESGRDIEKQPRRPGRARRSRRCWSTCRKCWTPWPIAANTNWIVGYANGRKRPRS